MICNNIEINNFSILDQIAILDFGSQYTHIIARRVRELHVFCELYSCLITAEELRKNKIKGIILSGGPNSVYDPLAPHLSPCIWKYIEEEKIPVLGICYGMQEIAYTFNGSVVPSKNREYGKANVNILCLNQEILLLDKLPLEFNVWMSHGDKLIECPIGFIDLGKTNHSEHAIIGNIEKNIYGLQFHPEVTHSGESGLQILYNFVINICKISKNWHMSNIATTFIEEIRQKIGLHSHVIGAVSGGVDSSVAAVLLQKAIGNRFHAILIDNGLLRENESKEVINRLRDDLKINIRCINASDIFLNKLKGIIDPEYKRKIIGNLFIEIFEQEAKNIDLLNDTTTNNGKINQAKIEYLLQGTLYPDVIESISYKGPSCTIKTHHNVGGLPEKMNLKLIEPLRELFKDEVRELGMILGIHKASLYRHPFPGPGLAIRILGEITKENLTILRQADTIFIDELRKTGHYDKTGQAFCVLLPCKSVGIMGDNRTYERVIAIRAVTTFDFMTADWYPMPYEVLGKMSNRIINEVQGINRVVYDISSKPPATIEWE